MASIRQLNQHIDTCSKQELASALKAMIENNSHCAAMAYQTMIERNVSRNNNVNTGGLLTTAGPPTVHNQRIPTTTISQPRKRKEEFVRIEQCTHCDKEFEPDCIRKEECHYHPGKSFFLFESLSQTRLIDA
jgi:hypothetical protein